jgi:hypothetical protein
VPLFTAGTVNPSRVICHLAGYTEERRIEC